MILARPFSFRRLMVFCPSVVRMRTRNPWVLLLCRLLGWYVRFIAKQLPVGLRGGIVPWRSESAHRCLDRRDHVLFRKPVLGDQHDQFLGRRLLQSQVKAVQGKNVSAA